MLRCNISLLVIQEPKHKETTKENGEFINKELQKYGLKGHFSNFQYFITTKQLLVQGLRVSNKNWEAGSIKFQLQIGNLCEQRFVNYFGCYAAAQGSYKYKKSSKEYKFGPTRDKHRSDVFHELKNILSKDSNQITRSGNNAFKTPSKQIIGEIILGDLQETISTTRRDNQGGLKYDLLKDGVLQAIHDSRKDMISIVCDYEGQEKYITRESLGDSKGGRGISHIMVDTRMEEMYVGGCVDKIIASTAFPTDHHIVAADFAFDIDNILLQERIPVEKFKWGEISNILMEIICSEDETDPTIRPKQDTPHTAEWERKMDLFNDLEDELDKKPEVQAAAECFFNKMNNLKLKMIEASTKLTMAEQHKGKLIDRLPIYKTTLEDEWEIFMPSLKKAATNLGLRTEREPTGKLKNNIATYKNPNDLSGNLQSVATFTSIIGNTRYLRATGKALQRLGRKVKTMKPNSTVYRDNLNHMNYLTNRLTLQANKYKIGERMIEAIETAELKQAEREIIQKCYSAHRHLDKFRDDSGTENTTRLSAEKTLAINDILKAAGCSHLFDKSSEPECDVITNEEVRIWNKVKVKVEESENKYCRRVDLLSDEAFYQAVDTTISNLEALIKTATNPRREIK